MRVKEEERCEKKGQKNPQNGPLKRINGVRLKQSIVNRNKTWLVGRSVGYVTTFDVYA